MANTNSYKPYNILKPYSTSKTGKSENSASRTSRLSNIYEVLRNNYTNQIDEDDAKNASIINGAAGANGGAIAGGLLGNAGIINGAAGAIAGAAAGALGGTQGNPANNTNQYDALYTGNSFKDWYKTHYGTNYTGQSYSRPEEMNDLDWDIGRALYDAYQREQALTDDYNKKTSYYKQMYNSQQNAAEAAYNNYLQDIEEAYKASVDSLNDDRNSSQQAASIMLDKAMKYLPEQLKAQGLGGLGVSASAALDANNNYMNQLGAIMELYNQNKGTLDLGHSNDLRELANGKLDSDTQRYNQYISSLMSLEDAYNANMLSNNTQSSNNVTDLLNYYRELEREEQDREYAAQDQIANNALFVLESMQGNPNYTDENGNLTQDGYKRISNYFASISSTLDEPTRNILESYLQGLTPDIASGSGIKDSSGQTITDYDSWNKLSSGKEIRGLENLRIQGDSNRWENKEGDDMWLTYPNADGTRHDYRFTTGESLSGNKYDEVWEYLEAARGRTPQEGDAVMYNGRLVVVVENGGLRYLKPLDAHPNALSDLERRLNALP